jgi:aminoglycoside phosphotransferase (APT) family kinase protein
MNHKVLKQAKYYTKAGCIFYAKYKKIGANCMFKSEWEKTQTRIHVEDHVIKQMLKAALLCRTDYAYEQISGGCVNLNYKISFADDSKPLLLRIYIRDPDSAYREQKIAQLLERYYDVVPVAKIFFIGDCEGYRYALVEYVFGVSLRDLLLHYDSTEWVDLVYASGKMLSMLGKIEFPAAGFFDKDLHVVTPFASGSIQDQIHTLLSAPPILTFLNHEQIEKIRQIFLHHADLMPDLSYHHLVHGDFDPSNILVEKKDDRWCIAALLDWEFAFSGSYLWDVSNMLRYAYRIPAAYKDAFLKGLRDAGVILPLNWEKTINLLNLVSLLDAVARGNPLESPNQYKDMYRLIDHQIDELQK